VPVCRAILLDEKHAHSTDLKDWLEGPQPGEEPDAEYEAWLDEEIARGRADAAAGRVVPLETVKEDFGLE
jgi:hypothetical protein